MRESPRQIRAFGRLLCRAACATGSYESGRALLIDDLLPRKKSEIQKITIKPRLPEKALALITLRPLPQPAVKIVRTGWKVGELARAIDEAAAQIRDGEGHAPN
jgi:hypothetical protein